MTTESNPNRVGGSPMSRRPQRAPDDLPVLWHLKVSHYNEKVRWALDYKGVPHARRAVDAGFHRGTARRLSGGDTLPVLVLDGRGIGDSTRIIAELERLHPEPKLYPADPKERERALELEEFFDEELGPSGYLAGPGFSVADLTLAALVAPVIAPEEFPYTQPQRHHPRLERVRAALDENGILEWAHRMYARHRGSSAEVAPG